MTLARTVIADTKCVGSYSIADHVVGPRVGRDQADAILAALAEAGFVVVPREPTEKMSQHALTVLDSCELETVEVAYRAMVEAANEQ